MRSAYRSFAADSERAIRVVPHPNRSAGCARQLLYIVRESIMTFVGGDFLGPFAMGRPLPGTFAKP